jgi:hypothetical protein
MTGSFIPELGFVDRRTPAEKKIAEDKEGREIQENAVGLFVNDLEVSLKVANKLKTGVKKLHERGLELDDQCKEVLDRFMSPDGSSEHIKRLDEIDSDLVILLKFFKANGIEIVDERMDAPKTEQGSVIDSAVMIEQTKEERGADDEARKAEILAKLGLEKSEPVPTLEGASGVTSKAEGNHSEDANESPEEKFDKLYKQKRLKELSKKFRFIMSGDAPKEVIEYFLSEVSMELFMLGIKKDEKIKQAYEKAEDLSSKKFEEISMDEMRTLKEMIDQCI